MNQPVPAPVLSVAMRKRKRTLWPAKRAQIDTRRPVAIALAHERRPAARAGCRSRLMIVAVVADVDRQGADVRERRAAVGAELEHTAVEVLRRADILEPVGVVEAQERRRSVRRRARRSDPARASGCRSLARSAPRRLISPLSSVVVVEAPGGGGSARRGPVVVVAGILHVVGESVLEHLVGATGGAPAPRARARSAGWSPSRCAATALRTCVQSAAVMPTVPTRLSHAWVSAVPRSA